MLKVRKDLSAASMIFERYINNANIMWCINNIMQNDEVYVHVNPRIVNQHDLATLCNFGFMPEHDWFRYRG